MSRGPINLGGDTSGLMGGNTLGKCDVEYVFTNLYQRFWDISYGPSYTMSTSTHLGKYLGHSYGPYRPSPSF